MSVVTDSLAAGLSMFWETLWALVVGFALSGAVQAFVSRARMQRALGDHRPATIAKAGLYGAISSSCSYAASALAKTLFVRGADFTAAQAFMFASTNLVVELGIVLWLLIGWQFALAEFVGGALMMAMLAVVLPRVVPAAEADAVRRRLLAGDTSGGHEHGHADAHDHGADGAPAEADIAPNSIRTRAGWSDAAGYTISDLTMLRKELVIGFLVAGIAEAAVPTSFWRSLFITGHGGWSLLENALLGPFLAIISFVCSIGNVPLGAALWAGGISFGGVVSFVFADLITIPLLLIYRKYYGTRLTLRLLAVFWATMSVAGLVTERLFAAFGGLPATPPPGTRTVGRDVFGWNYTSVLDVVALAGFAYLYWLYRSRDRFGGGAAYAKDPVCGMQVERAHPGATTRYHGATIYFCSDHCRERFEASPDRFAKALATDAAPSAHPATPAAGQPGAPQQTSLLLGRVPADWRPPEIATDPVCGMSVDPGTAAASAEHEGAAYHFCSEGCRSAFVADPAPFLAGNRSGDFMR